MEGASRDLFDFAQEFVKPGQVVWDLGANVGSFAYAAAHLAGESSRVVALEADTFLVGLLRRTAAAQPASSAPVTVLPAAVSESVGLAGFDIARRGRGTNHLSNLPGSSQTGGTRETVHVVSVTLDWLAERLPPPQVMKTDVEGAESKVFAGGEKVIAAAKPVILCEITGEYDFCGSFLRRLGYTLFDHEDRNRGPLSGVAHNTLALPPR